MQIVILKLSLISVFVDGRWGFIFKLLIFFTFEINFFFFYSDKSFSSTCMSVASWSDQQTIEVMNFEQPCYLFASCGM